MRFSQVPRVLESWQTDLKSHNRAKLAESIGSPVSQPELFEEGWEQALALEKNGAGV